jgi:hypothetical protein
MAVPMKDLEVLVGCCLYIRSKPSAYLIPGEDPHGVDSPSIDPPYPVYGGYFREESIMLLRRFYVQENEKGKSLHVDRQIPSRTWLMVCSTRTEI